MRVSRMLAFNGPNVWSRNPVVEMSLMPEPGPVNDADWRAGFRRLRDVWRILPTDLTTSTGDERFFDRLMNARHPAEAFADLILKLQTLAGTPVDWGRVETEGLNLTAVVAVEFVDEPIARMAVEMAHSLFWRKSDGGTPDLAGAVQRLRECAELACFGSTTRAIVAVARDRGIPVSRIDDDGLLQLGHGARQRRVQGAITGHAGYLAEAVSRDKLLTKRILGQLRIPTAEGRLVQGADEAWSAACDLGLPVVVKPRDSDYGNGVSVHLKTRDEVVAAWERARQFRPDVLVERLLAGHTHRLFVAANAVVAAVRREPAQVVGDGRRSVSELIDDANRDPRRGNGPECPLYPIPVDDSVREVLAQQELSLTSVPARGRLVSLQLDPSSCRAEEIVDVTDRVHPSVAAAVIDSVRAVGLDVAGVDVMAVDISRPLEEQGGGILEVNAGPALYLHRHPQCQPQRPVAEAVIESIFEAGETGRIPVVAVFGNERTGLVTQAIARLVKDGSRTVGVAGAAGISVGGRCATSAPSADIAGCRTLLAHPRVEMALCEISAASLRNEGLAFDECLVAVLTGFEENASVTAMRSDRARCLRLLAESVAPGGALVANVDDPEVADQLKPGQAPLLAASADPNHPFLVEHRAAGGCSISIAGGDVVLRQGYCEVRRLPLVATGCNEFLVPTEYRVFALLALAAAWAIDRALVVADPRWPGPDYSCTCLADVNAHQPDAQSTGSTSASAHRLRAE